MADTPPIKSAYAADTVEAVGEQPFFSSVLDAVTDGILVIDAEGMIVFANPAFADMLGRTPDDLVGESFADLVSDRHRGRYASSFGAESDAGSVVVDWSDVRIALRHEDGSDVPAEVSFRRSETDGIRVYTGLVHNLAQRDEEEEFSDGANDHLPSIIREVKDYAMFTLDPDGFIRNWNPGAENIKGYAEEEIVGRHFSTFYSDEDVEEDIPGHNLEQAKESGRFMTEGWRVRKDGSRFWAKVLITPLWYDDDTLRGFVKITQDITEQREYEETLRQERELLDEILNTTPIAVSVTNAEGDTLRANDRAAELLGISKEEILNELENPDKWVMFDEDGNELAPEEHPRARVLATGEPIYNEELLIQRPDGAQVWLSISTAPIYDDDGEIDRFVSAGEDITEMKRLQQQLERERDSLQAELDEVFGRITEAVFALDKEWRITYLNENMLALMGEPMEELLGRVFWEVSPGIMGTEIETQYRRAMGRQEAITFESQWEGDWFEIHAYPSETGLSVYFRDVTERKRQKQELEETVRKLEASNDKLERFAYVTSHDLQEPLRMVSSYLQLLERRYADELDSDAVEFIDYAVDGAERMRGMINDLLEYSRVSSSEWEFEPVDCNDAVEQARENVRVRIEESGAEINVEPLPIVSGNEDHLVQLFQNLLSNAIKYQGDESPRIDVTVESADDEWIFTVADNGIGMEPGRTDGIFEIFNRLHTDAEYSGTGIGLAICREIVENHGGEIWVDSEPGVGSQFSFSIPA